MRSARIQSWRAIGTAAAVAAVLLVAGCSRRPTADQAIDAALEKQGEHRGTVYPLGGKVMVDGQVPDTKSRGNILVVMLNDTSKPDVPLKQRYLARVNPQGDFTFFTYAPGDGVPPAKYVLTFAELKNNKKKGLLGPDQLKNLYNDPDKNAKVDEFVIDHKSPGKTDLVFNLSVQGKEPAEPGPHALTDLKDKS